jgi:uncharacterized protein (TIGR02118 family)
MKPGMTTVTVGYPNGADKTFDREYYMDKHIPLIRERFGTALKGLMVDYGLGGPVPGSDATYMTIATMYFESPDAFQNAFGPHADEILGDLKNFTNAEPMIQINEIAGMWH